MSELGSLVYTLRRSKKARRIRLILKPEGLELVIPQHGSERAAKAFLLQNQDWILRKVDDLKQRQNVLPSTPQPLALGQTVSFQGEEAVLKASLSLPRGRLAERHPDGSFLLRVGAGSESPSHQAIQKALLSWVKIWMVSEVNQMLDDTRARYVFQPRSIRVKEMKTRWGSCGPANDINLNWTLAFAPESVFRYVVFHEFCHMHHRNHSAAYWALVSEVWPRWQEDRQWLKAHGGELLRRFAT